MSAEVLVFTGASRGFGRLWTEAALARGDQVAATARNVTALEIIVNGRLITGQNPASAKLLGETLVKALEKYAVILK